MVPISTLLGKVLWRKQHFRGSLNKGKVSSQGPEALTVGTVFRHLFGRRLNHSL